MNNSNGLLWAYDVDSNGRGTQIGWEGLDLPQAGAFRWIHLERESERTQAWLRDQSGLTSIGTTALLAQETRPRATPMDDGFVVILRGVNLNPGADPEDMVSVRMWVEERRVITIWRGGRRLVALEEVRDGMIAGRGTSNTGEFVAELANRLVEPMSGVLSDLDEGLDLIEEEKEDSDPRELRATLLELRRQAIALRRYLAPQRDALSRLSTERIAWLGEQERAHIREVFDHTTRFVENLETARERAAITQEELANRLAEQLNKRMYALSIIAGIFLPLSFATGLLGINVGGIPGSDSPGAFAGVCAALVVLGIGEFVLFRKLGWI